MSKLTEIQCKNAKPREKAYKLFDGGGLYLEVTSTGSALWRLKYRSFDGKEKRASFGPYPLITLKEAREKRDDSKRLIASGKDPVQEKHTKRERAIEEENNTFEKIAREWHKLNEAEWTPEHAKTIKNRLEKDVFPIIGKMPIRKLTHKNLLDMGKSIQQRGANELAKRVIQMSRHIFQYAIITDRADRNLAEDLRGLIKAKPKKHFASLDIKELPEFLGALYTNEARLMPLTHLAVQFMMLTFVRTGEMIKAEWDEFDFEDKIWLIPAQRMCEIIYQEHGRTGEPITLIKNELLQRECCEAERKAWDRMVKEFSKARRQSEILRGRNLKAPHKDANSESFRSIWQWANLK